MFVALLLAQASLGTAAGFLIYEHGAAAAMAAFIIANDPSAIWLPGRHRLPQGHPPVDDLIMPSER
jgi:hypothetical protein